MDTPTLKMKVDLLQKDTRAYTTDRPVLFSMENVKEFLTEHQTYVAIVVGVLIFLVLLKPPFLYTERIEKGVAVKYFKIKKLLTYWLVFSVLTCFGVFMYYTRYRPQGN